MEDRRSTSALWMGRLMPSNRYRRKASEQFGTSLCLSDVNYSRWNTSKTQWLRTMASRRFIRCSRLPESAQVRKSMLHGWLSSQDDG